VKQKCKICDSIFTVEKQLNIPIESFSDSCNTKSLNLISCLSCGYERNMNVKSLGDAIMMQDHFQGKISSPNARQRRWPSRAAIVAKKINKILVTGGRVLDIGCNSGLNLSVLGKKWQLEGVELSTSLSEICRTFTGAKIWCMPIEKLEVPASSYDLITSYAVIEHVYDPHSFLHRIHELLRPGGVLVLMTGDRESEIARKLGHGWPLYVSPDHVSFFTARSIRTSLNKLGFDIISEDWRYMYFENGVGTFFQRFWYKLQEILNILPREKFDMYYVFAKKKN
jgi:SAM-dependent methyltransferase